MSGREAGSSGWPAGGGLTPRVGGEEARPPSRNPGLQGGAIRGGEAPASRQGQTPRVPSVTGGKQGQRALKETWRPWRAQEGAPCNPHLGSPSWERAQGTQEELGTVGRSLPEAGGRTTATAIPTTEDPREARLAYRPLGKGPAALSGRPALPQISRGGWAEESVAGGCRAQVFEGWEGFF